MSGQPDGSCPAEGATWPKVGTYCPECGRWVDGGHTDGHAVVVLPPRLWVYTNRDCNLHCQYCLVSSSPWAERRAIGMQRFAVLLEEACRLGIEELFLTGGEPFLLPSIFGIIAMAAPRLPTTVLSNGTLLRGRRLEKLAALNSPRLYIEVSLDDDRPEAHDLYRGRGSWRQAVEGIRLLQAAGLQVKVSTTVSSELEPRLARVRTFVRETLGIAEDHHITRPLVKRGFAEAGLPIGRDGLMPELTASADGFYWHPVALDADMLVTTDTSSLHGALDELARLARSRSASGEWQPFR